MHNVADLSDRTLETKVPGEQDSTVAHWFAQNTPMLPPNLDDVA
jgi:hypothetical protein